MTEAAILLPPGSTSTGQNQLLFRIYLLYRILLSIVFLAMLSLPATRQLVGSQDPSLYLTTALVFLVILTLLAITAMSTNTLDERMAMNSQDNNRAFQAAESGLTEAFTSGDTFTGTTKDSVSLTIANALGTYGASTSYNTAYIDSGEVEGYQDISTASDSELFKWHYYEVRSTGATATGAESTVGAGAKVLGK